MSNSSASRGLRTALLAFLGALLLGLAACNNQYGPPVPGQPVTPGQQRYLDNEAYRVLNEQRRS
jgi:hypothetical protein